MNTFYIILLLLLGALFLMAELVLLPGVTIGTILSLACYGGAIYLGFALYGTTVGIVVVAVVIVLALLTTRRHFSGNRVWRRCHPRKLPSAPLWT